MRMPRSQRPRKPEPEAEAVYVRLLECWLTDSVQGRHLLEDRTLPEARETVRKLIAHGLLDMQVIDLPGDHIRIEIFPTPLALARVQSEALSSSIPSPQ
jgi:hypothetical protein